MQVTVVGAGIVGLTTALVLEERGHTVRIVAAESGDATTSAVAAAVWFPYRCGPRDKVLRWSMTTGAWLEQLVATRAAGVDLLTGYEITATDERPWWAEGLEVDRVTAPVRIRDAARDGSVRDAVREAPDRAAPDREVPDREASGRDASTRDVPLAWRYHAPRVEPALFLPWLAGKLGARIERRRVDDLYAESGDVVVNCTGLASRELAYDDFVSALRGQVVIVELGDFDPTITISDDRDPDAMFYAIPRRNELVLGGCALPHPAGAPIDIDDAITGRILDQARGLGLAHGAAKRVRVGLRPAREEVRLERVGRIIHNYGHGGAGYTLCRGCAEDVAALVVG